MNYNGVRVSKGVCLWIKTLYNFFHISLVGSERTPMQVIFEGRFMMPERGIVNLHHLNVNPHRFTMDIPNI